MAPVSAELNADIEPEGRASYLGWDGADGHIVGFNPKYLLACLGGTLADKDGVVHLGFIDAQKPALIRETTDAGITRERLLMPVRTS